MVPKDYTGIVELNENQSNHRLVWVKNGKIHREDGPAIKYISEKPHGLNGSSYAEYWFLNDKMIKFPENISSNEDKIKYIKNINFI